MASQQVAVGSNGTISDKDSVWRGRVGSALRTVLACALVGCATLYGPEAVGGVVTYPAFSYMTTILIVSEATLGDSFRGFCQVAYATAQVVGPSVLALWAFGPARFTTDLAAVASVAVAAFAVALPESTPLLTKRIAFGQIVLIFVGIVVDGGHHHTGGCEAFFMHPIHVAASTALGAFASVFALLFPFPKLAYYQVRKGCMLYAENASKRVSLIVDAISAQDTTVAQHLISQLNNSLSNKQGPKLLQHLKANLGGMAWETPRIRMDYYSKQLGDIEKLIQGMEIALSSCSTFPVAFVDEQDLHKYLHHSKLQIALELEHAKRFVPHHLDEAATLTEQHLWNPNATSSFTAPQNLPPLFLLYCLEFLQDDHRMLLLSQSDETKAQQPPNTNKKSWENFIFAFKCSVSLALAVLFGLIYSKENGYWSGLTIAITFVTGRQATFTQANARAQGTAMGSVYGLLCVFLFQRCMDFRFVSLLPWIIFTSLLIHSRTYGQAGAFSAVIGALVIVGRKGYGPPTDFAIARLTEATIGLICFILVELLTNLSRATSLAEAELSQSLRLVQDCVTSIRVFSPGEKNELRENRRKLQYHLKELEKFTEEAEKEPNFWFRPFVGVRYRKLLCSFSTLVNLLHFIACQTEFLSRVHVSGDLDELLKHLNDDVKVMKEKIGFETESLQNEDDIEMGKPNYNMCINDILSVFFRRLEEVIEKVHDSEAGTSKFKRQMLLCLSGFGFCIRSLVMEVKDLEKQVKQLIKSDNNHPSTKA